MEALRILPAAETWMLLAFLFSCVLLPMLFLSRLIPSLAPEGHAETRWIDGLRGFAAAIVSLNHAPMVIANLVVMPKVFYLDSVNSKIPMLFGATGVQLFFCITGLLFTSRIVSKKTIDWTDFYAKRVRRVVPVYFVAATFAIIIAAWFSWPITQKPVEIIKALPGVYAFKFLPMPIINEFDFKRLLGVSWTLAIEWRFYFALPIIYIAAKKSINATLAAIIIFAIVDLWLSELSSWAFFIPGALSSFVMSKHFSKQVRTIASFVAVAALITIFYRVGDKSDYGLEQWVSVSILFTALTISRPRLLSARTFVAMGTVSYSFYLLHCMVLFLVFGAVHLYWTDVGLLSITNFSLLAGITLCFVSIISTASYIFIERRFMLKSGDANVNIVQGSSSLVHP
ncbi:acyltransferase family protein [Pseudomonas sp. IT-P294]|uniref:acyltransferase family protein n=1 Tax=Pseudomonas sp. IT-P294 TaxID=3026454 RepID=UPI0039DF53BA